MTSVTTPGVTSVDASREPSPRVASPADRVGGGWVTTVSNLLAAIFVLIALLAGYLFGASRLTEERAQQRLGAQLSHGAGLTAFAGKLPAEGQAVALLSIPSIGVKDFVVEGTSSADLQRGPGLLEGSAPPGTGGDTVIEGRRSTFGAPFARLPSLRAGDLVDVVGALGRFTYVVTGVMSLSSSSADPIEDAPDGELTMVTSGPSFLPTHPIVVQAKLQGAPVAADAAAPPPQATLGLAGDPAARFGVLLSAELLLALAVGVMVLRRGRFAGGRLPGMAWILLTPIALALLFELFEQTARLLPATM